MDRLWAPWRHKYVVNPGGEGCIFCKKPSENKDEENFILYRGERVFVIMNVYPYNNGHLMIAPYRHIGEVTELTADEVAEMANVCQKSVEVLKNKMSPDGFNIGMNLGKIAGAGFENHLHIHIVPRWSGDTNFMPVISNTKVIPISLQEAYRILKEGFED